MLAPFDHPHADTCEALLIVAWLVDLSRASFKTQCRRTTSPCAASGSYRVEPRSRTSPLEQFLETSRH